MRKEEKSRVTEKVENMSESILLQRTQHTSKLYDLFYKIFKKSQRIWGNNELQILMRTWLSGSAPGFESNGLGFEFGEKCPL